MFKRMQTYERMFKRMFKRLHRLYAPCTVVSIGHMNRTKKVICNLASPSNHILDHVLNYLADLRVVLSFSSFGRRWRAIS